jgi:integrase
MKKPEHKTKHKRTPTSYPGVFYREARRIGGKGTERVYYIVFKKDGKLHEEKVGRQFVNDLTPARVAGIRAERIEGKRPSRKEVREAEEAAKKAQISRWTVGKLWEEYKAQNPDLKGLVTDENRYKLHLKERFGDKEPRDLVQLDIDRLRITLLKTRKPQTVKHVLALLKRIVGFGVNKSFCDGLRFKIEMPQVDNLRTEDLTPDQLAALVKAIDEDDNREAAAIMKLALYSGMRRGEILKLRWDDVDLERGFVFIRAPKGGKGQSIPINDAAKLILETHPRGESPLVFPGRNGNPRPKLNARFIRRIRKKAGFPKGFRPMHGLRHVYASTLASSGEVDMYALQRLLTHKSPQMTQRYAHLRDEALRRASSLAGNLIDQALKNTKKGEESTDQTA